MTRRSSPIFEISSWWRNQSIIVHRLWVPISFVSRILYFVHCIYYTKSRQYYVVFSLFTLFSINYHRIQHPCHNLFCSATKTDKYLNKVHVVPKHFSSPILFNRPLSCSHPYSDHLLVEPTPLRVAPKFVAFRLDSNNICA